MDSKQKKQKVEQLLKSFEQQDIDLKAYSSQPYYKNVSTGKALDKDAESMAIIGLAGRYPQSKDLDQFWLNLLEGNNCIRETKNQRYDSESYYGDPKIEVGKTNIRHFGLLDDIYRFDASFFNISNREAEIMDPHMRLMLETVWSCIENAGYKPKSLAGTKTGVFVSFYNYEYAELVKGLEIEKSSEPYLGTGMAGTIMANRISFILGLNGPSEVYNTACSSALVALHRAIQAILAGDCDQVLLTGASLLLTPNRIISLSKLGILNESRVCNPFSYPANKEIIGEGVGAIMIKPLAKAIEDHDYIYAVVNGTDVNHHGNLSGRLTLPSSQSLSRLMSTTYKKTAIDIDKLCYIEGHGSGNDTDVAELLAYQDVLKHYPANGKRIPVGSLKSNFGFGEGSGGIAQLTKCALAFHHHLIPSTLHFEKTDPVFDLEQSHLKIQTSNTQLDLDKKQQYMSVIAYGLGGTNAHVVMSNYSNEKNKSIKEQNISCFPMIFSAKSPEILTAYLNDIYHHLCLPSNHKQYLFLCNTEPALLKSLSLTLIGRERLLDSRLVFLVDSYQSLLQCCEQFLLGQKNNKTFYLNGVSIEKQEGACLENNSLENNSLENNSLENNIKNKDVKAMAHAWANGESVPWVRLYDDVCYQKLPLPALPFMGNIHQLKSKNEVPPATLPLAQSSSKNTSIEERFVIIQVEGITRVDITIYHDDYFISQHVVNQIPIMPGVAYLAILCRIGKAIFKLDTCIIKNIAWLMPFDLEKSTSIMQFDFTDSGHFRVFQKDQNKLCCKGQLELDKSLLLNNFYPQVNLSMLESVPAIVNKEDYWRWMNSVESKQQHGVDFRRLSALYPQQGKIIGILEPGHKSLLMGEIPFYDSSLGVCCGFDFIAQQPLSAIVPFSVEAFYFFKSIDPYQQYYVAVEKRDGKLPRYNISIENRRGDIYAVFSGFFAKSFDALSTVNPYSDDIRENILVNKNRKNITNITLQETSYGESVNADRAPANSDYLSMRLKTELQENVADFLKVEVDQVPLNETLEPFGLDSIAVNELTDQMSLTMNIDIPATMMFEYQSINEVVDFLLDEFQEDIDTYFNSRQTPDVDKGIVSMPPNSSISSADVDKEETTYQRPDQKNTDIAIIGIGGLFPAANNFREFWEKIKTGQDLITEMPGERRASVYNVYSDSVKDLKGIYGGFVENAEKFDAKFFNLSDDEVMAMDPQQRLFLEATWHAIEDAGYYPLSFSGQKIGVYVGAIVNEYKQFLQDAKYPAVLPYMATGNTLSGIANRTSHFFDFNGPSESIDTACCSSLYAIDRAVRDINTGVCEMSIAGGVNFIAGVEGFELYRAMDYLAKDWRCKAFADEGDGWSKSELFAAVLLKKYDKALQDKDHIYGVIRSTGTNHGGKSYFYTQPNSSKHYELIKEVYRTANVDPRSMVHVEAHGTGTNMGDALEFNVISRAIKDLAKDKGIALATNYCAVGSVKSNIGHAEAASGMAGFLKTVMLLHDKVIPPSLHIDVANKNIRTDKSPLFLARESLARESLAEQQYLQEQTWNGKEEQASCAGVHSFNFSGAAAHVLVAEHRGSNSEDTPLGITSYPLCLSAKTPQALFEYCRDLLELIQSEATFSTQFERIVYTINSSKSFLDYRLAIRASSFSELINALISILDSAAIDKISAIDSVYYRHIKQKTFSPIQYPELANSNIDELVELWLTEARFDWSVVLKPYSIQKLSLPSYPFQNTTAYFPAIDSVLKDSSVDNKKVHQEKIYENPHSSSLQADFPQQSPPKKTPVSVIRSCFSAESVEKQLCAIVADLLSLDPQEIDVNRNVSEYSFDSMRIVSLSDTINKIFSVDTRPPDFFEFSTLNEMIAFVDEMTSSVDWKVDSVSVEDIPSQDDTAVDEALSHHSPGQQTDHLDIAIVGMSGRFPMAQNVEEFWANLQAGKDCIEEIPEDRWDWRAIYGNPQQEMNKTNVKWGGFIEGVAEFDPLFFGISPREAELMDPQQRLLMTYAWLALEDAGYSAASFAGSNTGIFVGTMESGYSHLIARAGRAIEGYSATGVIPSVGPSRMSYFLDLHGPSEPVETACSSSLVAMHKAIMAIHAGDCEQAIVGGVNTIVSPDAHIGFSKAGMLCEDGRCKTFSSQANGYVRGEGVGMLLLKTLTAAEKDGDRIYGLVRGSAQNHGGRANSLTAPNPKAQAELLVSAYKSAGIDPRTVSYIEAHGTGTSLGDPIEINGLKTAFKKLYQQTGSTRIEGAHCGIGSVKTNIGHLELAAGVAGVIKVLLQLQHKKLVKSLHCEEINPYIDLKDSPFYVVQEEQEWLALRDSHGQQLPRRAGVSSFGFGGVNAHVVLEEYSAQDKQASAELSDIDLDQPLIVPLSASSDERLQDSVKNLLAFIQAPAAIKGGKIYLENLAYTLQVGREAMPERLALIVSSMQELKSGLQCFLENKKNSDGVYYGRLQSNKDPLLTYAADEDMASMIEAWINKKKYPKLVNLWVQGLSFDWNKLYTNNKPQRISAPTYPFAKEHYWIEVKDPAEHYQTLSQPAPTAEKTASHPLLHKNTSSFSGQSFNSSFTGEEFFLQDHQIQGKKILPAVAYLEMAQAAFAQALGRSFDGRNIQISHVIWVRPLIVNDAQDVRISLIPQDGEDVSYEISSTPVNSEQAPLVHCQGMMTLITAKKTRGLDLDELSSKLSVHKLTKEDCYTAYKSMGFNYGGAHQGLEGIYLGEQEALAKLILPPSLLATRSRFTLHPSLLDAALQATFAVGNAKTFPPLSSASLPFALDRLDIITACSESMWAWIRPSVKNLSTRLGKLDIDLCDNRGKVCVKIRGFSSRAVTDELSSRESLTENSSPANTLIVKPVWKEKALDRQQDFLAYAEHHVFLCDLASCSQALKDQAPQISFVHLDSTHLETPIKTIAQDFEAHALVIFKAIQNILQTKPKNKVLLQVVIPAEGPQQVYSALSGLLKTAGLENPNLLGQVIAVPTVESADGLVHKLQSNSQAIEDQDIRYQGNRRLVRSFEDISDIGGLQPLALKQGGVYLITGGMGGLGVIFARDIAEKVQTTTLILIGRSTLSKEQRGVLTGLQQLNVVVDYQPVDSCDLQALIELVNTIVTRYGAINGIFHAAGLTCDNFIVKKTSAEFKKVLAPKVTGLINMDQATRQLDLDFFVLFSSVSAVMGNIGQADYSTANAFMDSFSDYRNSLLLSNQRRGKTLSINWPLWKQGGMKVDKTVEEIMRDNTGMLPLENSLALDSFYHCLMAGESQLILAAGDVLKIKRYLLSGDAVLEPESLPDKAIKNSQPSATTPVTTNDNDCYFEDKVKDYLKGVISSVLKIPEVNLKEDSSLDDYGVDSILSLDLIRALEKNMGSLAKTLFFEYESIQAISEYFISQYREKLLDFIDLGFSAEISYPALDDVEQSAPVLLTSTNNKQYLASDNDVIPEIIEKNSISDNDNIYHKLIDIRGYESQDATFLDLWPAIFISKNNDGYISFLDDKTLVFVAEYRGERSNERELMMDLIEYCGNNDRQLCYFSMTGKRKTELEEKHGFISLPMGVMQVIDIPGFTLTGKKMRRLRYMVDRFRAAGDCQVREYKQLNTEINSAIKSVIYKWSEQKKVVNNVETVLKDIASGNLLRRYRVFLTYMDKQLQNVILMLPVQDGYLMDQEYYLAEMELGGTEFAVVEIIKRFKEEGHRIFSLGLTWGLFEPKEGYSDDHGWTWVNNKKGQIAQIFQRGEQNYQYKNKYRPQNYPVYLYRPQDSKTDVITRFFSQFFKQGISYEQVGKLIASDGEEGRAKDPSIEIVDEFYDVTHIDTELVKLDLISDSWPHLNYEFIYDRVRLLAEKVDPQQVDDSVIERLLGFSHYSFCPSGRIAERLFFKTYRTKNKKIIQNILFDTIVHNQLKAGFEPIEIPDPEIFNFDSDKIFRGGIDLDLLRETLIEHAGEISMVFLELCSNASGGYPVSVKQIKAISTLTHQYQLPLVIDITRAIRNSELIRQHENGYKNKDLWSIFKETLGYADCIIGSLCKDFGLNVGGIIASRHLKQIESIKKYSSIEGGMVSTFDKKLIFKSLEDRDYLERQVRDQLEATRQFHQELLLKKIPTVQPGVGHCILIPVNQIPGYEGLKYPKESFLRRLYETYGIRGGIHLVGNQQGSTLNQCIRLALPIGLEYQKLLPYLCEALSSLSGQDSCSTVDVKQQEVTALADNRIQFPEIIHLNHVSQGVPVFWFHAGLGGVQPYHMIAENSQRPFYGIQARGYQTEETPLQGIQAIAAYYIDIIQSVQATGPYDLGGFSLGGVIAYEVARQLQEIGQEVNTITMLDTPDTVGLKNAQFVPKSSMLQAANTLLAAPVMQDLEAIRKLLIHRSELDISLDDNAFLKQLSRIIKQRGLNRTEADLQKTILHMVNVQHGYKMPHFSILPLIDSAGISCYYFRNKNGIFWGEFEPFYTSEENEAPFEGINYWSEWEKNITDFHIMDVDASSHIMLLSEPRVCEALITFCKDLYSEKRISESFLTSFKNKIKIEHGEIAVN